MTTTYAPGDRVEVYDEGAWRPGRITHLGPREVSGRGIMTLAGIAEGWCRVLVDRSAAGPGYSIQAPTNDPTVLRHEPVPPPVVEGEQPFPDRPQRETQPTGTTEPAARPLALGDVIETAEELEARARIGDRIRDATGDCGTRREPDWAGDTWQPEEPYTAAAMGPGFWCYPVEVIETAEQAAARAAAPAAPSMPLALDEAAVYRALRDTPVMIADGTHHGPMSRPSIERIAADLAAAGVVENEAQAVARRARNVEIAEGMVAAMAAAARLRGLLLDGAGTEGRRLRTTLASAPEVLADLRTVLDHVAPPTTFDTPCDPRGCCEAGQACEVHAPLHSPPEPTGPDPEAVRDAARVARGDLARSMGRGPVQRAMGVLADWAAATLPEETV